MALLGTYHVTPTKSAIDRAWKLCKGRARDVMRIRAHALNLAFWPDHDLLNWDWITSLDGKRVGELRIDETIAGFNNLRVIFFKANKPLPGEQMKRIWTLSVFQKKSQEFTGKEIAAFRTMRDILVAREYAGIVGA